MLAISQKERHLACYIKCNIKFTYLAGLFCVTIVIQFIDLYEVNFKLFGDFNVVVIKVYIYGLHDLHAVVE